MKIPLIEQVKLQAQVLVPLVQALRVELGEARANAIVRKALGETYRRFGEKWWRQNGTANLGDTKTTITHPATTTHGRLTPEQRAAAGIGDGLLRIAVGLEAIGDIQADLARGLGA